MQTIQLEVDDNNLASFLKVLNGLKDGVINNLTISSNKQTTTFIDSEQFKKDKIYFNKCLSDIEEGNIKLYNNQEYKTKMNTFVKSLNNKYANN